MARILIIEDEPDIVMSLEEDLRRQGHQVSHAADGERGLAMAREGGWDLILLDVMLPKNDGFDVCARIAHAPACDAHHHADRASAGGRERCSASTPAPTTTSPSRSARASCGRRIRARLRRSAPARTRRRLRFGECEMDFARHEVRRGGTPVELTPLEFNLLPAFCNRGRAFTREQVLDLAWGQGIAVSERVVTATSSASAGPSRTIRPVRRTRRSWRSSRARTAAEVADAISAATGWPTRRLAEGDARGRP